MSVACTECQKVYSATQCPACAEKRHPRINKQGYWRARDDEMAIQLSRDDIGNQLRLDATQVALIQEEVGQYQILQHPKTYAFPFWKHSSSKVAVFSMGAHSLRFHYHKLGLLDNVALCFQIRIISTDIPLFYNDILKSRRVVTTYYLEDRLANVVKQCLMGFCSVQNAEEVTDLLEMNLEQRRTKFSDYLFQKIPLYPIFNGLELLEVESLECKKERFDQVQDELLKGQLDEVLATTKHEYDRSQLARKEECRTSELKIKDKEVSSEIAHREKCREQAEKDVQLEQQKLALEQQWYKLSEMTKMAEERAKDNEHKRKLQRGAARAEFVLNTVKEQASRIPTGMANIRCMACGQDNLYQGKVEPELCAYCQVRL